MDYRLLIHKGEELILDKVIDADTVIELMRGGGPIPSGEIKTDS